MSSNLVDRVFPSKMVHPTKDTIESLIIEAEGYGRVAIYCWPPKHDNPRTYHVGIEFNTTKGIDLEATSSYDETTLLAALQAALSKAKEIQRQFK